MTTEIVDVDKAAPLDPEMHLNAKSDKLAELEDPDEGLSDEERARIVYISLPTPRMCYALIYAEPILSKTNYACM